ncbi:gp03 [Burkholderia pseudomallei]|nr:gp03 [Burkholderia pseudomallei]
MTTTENSRADALTERDYDLHEHEQGLYRKFEVRRVDGSSEPGGKHHDCEYFVLDMTHDQHARAALRAYADACASTHPELSADLIARYALAPIEQPAVAPIDMLLFCPKCGVQHVDAPEKASEGHPVLYADAWTNSPHRSHLCHACGTIWRPADVPTNGVVAIQTRGKADTWDGEPADEWTASFETWCDRFPEISAVERLREAWQEARAALPEDRIDWIANTHCPGGTAYPVNVKNAIREALREARISDNETGAEGAIVGAWLTEDGRAISAEQKAGMLRDGGAGASSVQPYSIPCYLGAASAMAAEAVAFEITEQAAAEWASRHDVDHVLKHFSTQRNAIEDARTLHLLAAAPQPAQAGARVGLTDEQRDAIDFVIGWYEQSTIADNPYREHIAALRALLSARPAESWQVEIDAYKREVRELEAVLRIPEKIEDDWIRADVHSPTEAGIPHDDDVLAWNNDPGFATIISASFISPSFPEYTHWKKKPEAPADIDHAKGVDHAE